MLGIIAGEGKLPAILAEGSAEPPLICTPEGFLPEGIDPDIVFRVETLGTLIETMKAKGVDEVCFAGAVRRPPIEPTRIDAATWPLVPILQQAVGQGDDAALRALIAIFENAGISVRGAHEVLPSLLPPAGVLSRQQPDGDLKRDAERGFSVLETLSAADLGQSCAVHKGQVLAVEGSFGTDWMLASLNARPDAGGGVFCKAPKTGQDLRADMPAIGPETVTRVAEAGLSGLVVAAGGVMILELDRVLAACDQSGLCLWVRPQET